MTQRIDPAEVRKVERRAKVMGLRMLVLCERMSEAKTAEQALRMMRSGLLADMQKLPAEDPEAFYLTLCSAMAMLGTAFDKDDPPGPPEAKPSAGKEAN